MLTSTESNRESKHTIDLPLGRAEHLSCVWKTMSVDFRGGCLFYKVLALLSGCPSLCTLDPSPGDAEHPQPSLTQAHGCAHIK